MLQILHSIRDTKQFDEKFYRSFYIDLKKENKKNQRCIIIVLIFTLTYLIFSVLFTIKSTIREVTLGRLGELVLYIGPFVISTLAEFQFCAVVLCLKQRFRWLNKIIIETSKQPATIK